MRREVDTNPEYVVFIANPELEPQFKVYEIERGCFLSMSEAVRFAETLLEQGVEAVQISERQWRPVTIARRWMTAKNHKTAKSFNTTID